MKIKYENMRLLSNAGNISMQYSIDLSFKQSVKIVNFTLLKWQKCNKRNKPKILV